MSNFRRRLMCKKVESDLPSGYTRLNYLESTGTQYINTNYIINEDNLQNIDFEIKVNCDDYAKISSISDGRICGASSGNVSYVGAYYDNSGSINVIKRIIKNEITSLVKVKAANKSLIYLNGFDVYKNNVLQGTIQNSPLFITDFAKKFLLFAYNTTTIQKAKYNTKIYSFKLWDNKVLVRDMIPCCKKKDNVVGLYDLVDKIFYTNAGTGEFLYG